MTVDPVTIEATILRLAAEAGSKRSISPTDAARELTAGDDWQVLMPAIRRAAVKLALAGQLVIYRKGKPVDPNDFKGVYRPGLPAMKGQDPETAPSSCP